MKLIFFDLETSGLDPKVHAIIQIAAMAVDISNGWQVLEEFERKVLFQVANASPEALEINSYDQETWEREAIHPRQAVGEFSAFLKRHATVAKISKRGSAYSVAQLAAHHAQFDAEFLQTWYKRLDEFLPANYFVMDTLQMALQRQVLDGVEYADLKLITLCRHHGIALEQEHDALADVKLTAALCRLLSAGYRLDTGIQPDANAILTQTKRIMAGLPVELK